MEPDAPEQDTRVSNVFLIGYRGTGKTTVAERLANVLGRPWVDADVEIERHACKSIAAIFAESGERAFRDLESQVLAELAARSGWIVSVGGGGILRPENRAALRAGGKCVWLQASPASIWRRLEADPATAVRRPQLTADGGMQEIESLLAQRTPLYAEAADVAVDTEGKTPEAIAHEIIAVLKLNE